uniref:alpha/beta fold hydrolase n=1 Tax=Actinomadura hibisca TaxID=68565 RepID=UPI000A900C3D
GGLQPTAQPQARAGFPRPTNNLQPRAGLIQRPGDPSPCGFPTPDSDDFILNQASLYWFTRTISTSFRPYYEYASGLTRRVERVEVPIAVAVFPADLTQPPRSWAERIYNVTRYTRMPRGGHFPAHEEPELLAYDITEFFRAHR